jgi:predicted TIM-barrel fold metal-dependent hydrolase
MSAIESQMRSDPTALRPADRFVVVSSDGHAGPPVAMYRQYLERGVLEAFDEYAGLVEAYDERAATGAGVVGPLVSAAGDDARSRQVTAGLTGNQMKGLWEPDTRLRDMESDGVAAEVIFPQGAVPFHPYPALGIVNPADLIEFTTDPTLLRAGIRAYNRWLGDFCSAHPGRRAGVGVVPIGEVDLAVREADWIAKTGLLGGVSLPPIVAERPGYNDPVYEPFWSACESLDLPLNVHGGGVRTYYGPGPESTAIRLAETDWYMQRTLWFMIFGGVFERHRGLRLVFTEQRAHWAAPLLDSLDSIYESAQARAHEYLPRRPSEYFAQSVYIGASFLSRKEAEMRDRIGRDHLMWGSDYPHTEGTWPWTLASIRKTFAGLPLEDVRMMLGENAIRCYRLDPQQLAEVAARIGPTITEVNQHYEGWPQDAARSWGFRDRGIWS